MAKRKVKLVFVDRYSATGTPRPERETVCRGQCEGMGVVPVAPDDMSQPWRRLWLEKEKKNGPSEDGYHFVTCPTCGGSGRRDKKGGSPRRRVGDN